MISGTDIIWKSTAAPEYVFEEAVHGCRLFWPKAVVENAENGSLLIENSVIFREMFCGVCEIMVYRDQCYRKRWDAAGYIPETRNTMIHVLKKRWDQITVVVDDANDSNVKMLLERLRKL
jgi:hypothetical protein